MKKLLALSEPTSSKARPKSSPPPIHRNKIGGLVGATKALAVDLTAESSSVTSLPAARKGNHNSGKQIRQIPACSLIDVLCRQPIKLFQVVSTSEFHEY